MADDDIDMAAALMADEADDGGSVGGENDEERMEAVYDIPVEVTAVLGTANLQVSQILKLGRGAVVELDRVVGEPVDINANNRLIARGEVVVVEDRLAIQMTEIIRSNIR